MSTPNYSELHQLSDEELVSRWRAETKRLSSREAAEAAGVTHTTVQRFEGEFGKDWKKLHASTRRKLEDHLARLGTKMGANRPEGLRAAGWDALTDASVDDLRSELLAEMRGIRESGEPTHVQILARDSVASMISAAAMFAEALARDTAERAALARAEAVKLIESNGQARAAQASTEHRSSANWEAVERQLAELKTKLDESDRRAGQA